MRLQSTGAALAAAAAAAVAEEGKAQAVAAVVAAAPDSHETFSSRAYRDEFAGGWMVSRGVGGLGGLQAVG